MAVRPPSGLRYPCYYMYRDNRSEWRWVYYGDNAEEIAVSSEGYTTKQNCRRGIEIMKGSGGSPISEQAD